MNQNIVSIDIDLKGPEHIAKAWKANCDVLLKPVLNWISAQTEAPCIRTNPDGSKFQVEDHVDVQLTGPKDLIAMLDSLGNEKIVKILEDKLDTAYSPWRPLSTQPDTNGAYEFRELGKSPLPFPRYAYFKDGRWGAPAGTPDAAASRFALGSFLTCGPAQYRGLAKEPKQPEVTKTDIVKKFAEHHRMPMFELNPSNSPFTMADVKGFLKLNDPVERRPHMATFGELKIGDRFIIAGFGRPLTKHSDHLARYSRVAEDAVLMPVDATRIVTRVPAIEPAKIVTNAERGAWLLKQGNLDIYQNRFGGWKVYVGSGAETPVSNTFEAPTKNEAIDKAMKARP